MVEIKYQMDIPFDELAALEDNFLNEDINEKLSDEDVYEMFKNMDWNKIAW
jgi:hypothetical protein